ncbi:MAG: hypothetical protein RL660_2617 [Bacteroidota bacterium]
MLPRRICAAFSIVNCSIFHCLYVLPLTSLQRGARVVEGGRLESGYACKRIEGSNPFLSALF